MPKAQPLLLDLYPNAAVAYSLRKLRNAYSGSAIRVRRSSDNAEQNISFVGNNLDTASLLSFVGAENLFQRSEDFNDTYWTKSVSAIDSNSITAPDGLTTADTLRKNGSADSFSRRVSRNVVLANSTDYTVSIYAKEKEYNEIFLQVLRKDNTASTARFNLNSGTIVSSTNTISQAMESVGNGWYRCSIKFNSLTGVASERVDYVLSNNGVVSFPDTGTQGIYIWGAQLNTNDLQPYFKTVGSTNAGNGFVVTWYDQSTNGNNATQATAGRQPIIVSSGVVNLLNNKPSVLSNTTLTALRTISNFTYSQIYISTVFNRIARVGVNDSLYIWDGTPFNQLYSNSSFWTGFPGVNQNTNIPLSVNQKLLTQNYNGVTNLYFENSNQTSSANLSFNVSNRALEFFGYQPLNYGTRGNIQEIIIYPTDQSTNRTGIETNINSHYNIYP
jgi:hypothetical protein